MLKYQNHQKKDRKMQLKKLDQLKAKLMNHGQKMQLKKTGQKMQLKTVLLKKRYNKLIFLKILKWLL